MPSTVTAVPVTSSASTAAFMQLTAEKLDRTVTMINTSQAATRQSLRSEFTTDQEETAERAAKKARLSADVVFCKEGNEKQVHFNEELQEKIQIAGAQVHEASTSSASLQTSLVLQQAAQALEEGIYPFAQI